MPIPYIPAPNPVVDKQDKVTRPWLLYFQQLSQTSGTTPVGPGSSTNDAIVRWDGTTGSQLKNSGITIPDGATGTLSGTNTGDQAAFQYVAVLGQPDVVANGPGAILTLVAGTNIVLTTDPVTDVVRIDAAGIGGGTVTTTGTPTTGELSVFSGGSSITNGNLSGDVFTLDSLLTTITAGAVTLSKLQNISTQRILGRDTAGTGSPEQITISQALDWLTT